MTNSNTNVTMKDKSKLIIVEYLREGKSLFKRWFDSLDAVPAAKVTTALYRLEQGNVSNVKSVGSGVMECKVDYGPGYRIYFGMEGNKLIILLGGGSKRTQKKDIIKTKASWLQYKADKRNKG